jgi:hypothetical protein
MTERCEGIIKAGEQCRCYAEARLNGVPYCLQHAEKEVRALASEVNTMDGGTAGEKRSGSA